MTSTNNRGKFHYAWVILIVATLVLGVYVPIVNSLSNTWQLAVTSDLGFSRTKFSFNTTITQAVGIFLGPVVSYFLTKYNFKRIWRLSALIFAGAVFGYSLAQNEYHFYILAFFVGLAYITTAQIPMMMLINNWFNEKRGLATSIAVSGISAGGALLSPMISSLIKNLGWRSSYRVYAIIILLIAVVAGYFLIYLKPENLGLKPYGYKPNDVNDNEEDNNDMHVDKINEEATRANLETEGSEEKMKSLNVGLTISASLTTSFFIFLLLGSVMNGLSNGATLQFPPALQDAAGVGTAGKVVALYLLLGVFGKLLIGRLADKYGICIALALSSVALALSFVCMLFADQTWGAWAVAIVFGFGLAIGTVIPPLITSAIFDRNMYGEAYGFVQSSMQVGAAFGPLLVSLIYDHSGIYAWAWIINIVFTLLTGILWILAHKRAEIYANKVEK